MQQLQINQGIVHLLQTFDQIKQRQLTVALRDMKPQKKVHQRTRSTQQFEKMIVTYYWSLAVNRIDKVIRSKLKQNSTIFLLLMHQRSALDRIVKILKHQLILPFHLILEQKSKKQRKFVLKLPDLLDTGLPNTPQIRLAISDVRQTAVERDSIFNRSQSSITHEPLTGFLKATTKGSYIQDLQINENFIDLFNGQQKQSTKFAQLSPLAVKKQVTLKQKLKKGSSLNPINWDLEIFLNLVKKKKMPQKEQIHIQRVQQYDPMYFVYSLIVLCAILKILQFMFFF